MQTTNNYTHQQLTDVLVWDAMIHGAATINKYSEKDALQAADYYRLEHGTLEGICDDLDAITYERIESEILSTLLRFKLL